MTIAALHQPNFLPYLGFFDKLKRSDIFVIRDEVLFVRKDFHHRNKIRINGNDNLNNPQFKWLNAPVIDNYDYIKHVAIKHDPKNQWSQNLLHDIKVNYSKSQNFNTYYPTLEKIFLENEQSLLNLNMKIIHFLKEAFEIDTKIILASELGLKPEHYQKSDATDDIINICKAIGADTYLSGDGGKNYLKADAFLKASIKLIYQEYKHPSYKQNFPGFLPYMSAIDALFCRGNSLLDKNDSMINSEITIKGKMQAA